MKYLLGLSAIARIFAFFFLILALAVPVSAQDARQPVKITLTTLDVPGATVTGVSGINTAGDMVGDYGQSTSGPLSGFLYSAGSFTYFEYPGESVTVPGGINDSGLIAGYATQDAEERFTVVGFLYDGTTFTTLQDGHYDVTNVYGLNNAGTVVGSAGADLGSWSGLEEKGGKYKTVNFPGSYVYGYATGINDLGEIVGLTISGTDYRGYVIKNSKVQNVDYPGTSETAAMGINDAGVIVGWYGSGSLTYAFVHLNGKYISFGYPGAKATFAEGINRSGQVVGGYTTDYQTYHGFVSSPITAAEFDPVGSSRVALVDGR